jgi:hypothetical protein
MDVRQQKRNSAQRRIRKIWRGGSLEVSTGERIADRVDDSVEDSVDDGAM